MSSLCVFVCMCLCLHLRPLRRRWRLSLFCILFSSGSVDRCENHNLQTAQGSLVAFVTKLLLPRHQPMTTIVTFAFFFFSCVSLPLDNRSGWHVYTGTLVIDEETYRQSHSLKHSHWHTRRHKDTRGHGSICQECLQLPTRRLERVARVPPLGHRAVRGQEKLVRRRAIHFEQRSRHAKTWMFTNDSCKSPGESCCCLTRCRDLPGEMVDSVGGGGGCGVCVCLSVLKLVAVLQVVHSVRFYTRRKREREAAWFLHALIKYLNCAGKENEPLTKRYPPKVRVMCSMLGVCVCVLVLVPLSFDVVWLGGNILFINCCLGFHLWSCFYNKLIHTGKLNFSLPLPLSLPSSQPSLGRESKSITYAWVFTLDRIFYLNF